MSDEIIINIFDDPVQSVNGQTGDVVLDISESILKGPVIPLSGSLLTTGTISSLDVPVYVAGTKPGYRLEVVNRANFDPGEPFTVDGRARVVHGMTFQAGIPNFTNGSDHSHVFWIAQGRRSWQMIQNGGTDADNSQFGENNIFQLTTPMNNMAQTRFNELQIHSIDTTDIVTNVNTPPYVATNIKINYNTVTPVLVPNQFCQLNFNLGFAGIVASTYVGKVLSGPTSVQVNGETKFQYTFQIEGLDNIHWLPNIKGLVPVTFNSSLDRMGLIVLTGQQVITGTQTGLTGNYLNVGRYVLVGQQNHNAYVGAPVVLSITQSSKIGLVPRDYNAYVKDVIDSNHYMLSVGNSFLWPNTSGTTGIGGWAVYKGSTDGVHQYTPATQHFWFQRFKTNDINTVTTGGSRAVALGSGAETNGYFTYALGYNSSILKNTTGPALTASSVFGGSHSFVQGSYATALGGERLIIKRDNQTALGKFNNPDTEALLVIGNGSSQNNRSNILEAHTNKLSVSGSLETTGSILSAGINLFDIFLTSETDSQSLSFDESSQDLSISGGNVVSLSSINSVFASNSSRYDSVYSNVNSLSGNWDSVYSNVNSTSANNQSVYNNVNSLSGNWDSVYSNVNSTSAVPYGRFYIEGTNGLFNMLNNTEHIIPWNQEIQQFDDIIEPRLSNKNILIKKTGRYHVKVRFACFDMQDTSDYLRIRLRGQNGSPITTVNGGIFLTTLAWRFVGGASINNGEMYVEGETVIDVGTLSGEYYIVATVYGVGGNAGGGTYYYPVFTSSLGLTPYMEVTKID